MGKILFQWGYYCNNGNLDNDGYYKNGKKICEV